MKSIITILCFILLAKNSSAQIDTFAFLKNFELQKAQYIGQPFSVLLNAMGQVQPKSAWGGRNARNKTQIPYCTFNFVTPDNCFSYLGVITMLVDWQTFIPSQDIDYYSNLNHFYFTNSERQFYSNKIIKDISVYMSY
jgi:hypothetical protein